MGNKVGEMRSLSRVQRTVLFSVILATLPSLVTSARATTIEFVATNLSDVTPGQDLWRYDYTVSGRSFLASEFFDIYFDPQPYRTLTVGSALNANWDVRILQQPNPVNLPPFDTGIFDAFALVNNPSLAGTASVSFIYLGTGSPGAQMFQIYGANSSLLESGFTTPRTPSGVIPEPSTVVLCLLGLAAFGIKTHVRHRALH